ncbi:MAG: menaquinone biosynthesis decarboxylase [Desulfatiglans sp.]|jgi:4-hydroxy-3-polyprenylbenzoate decarboxylase|nr:menaquinone biosynthesis decarboxylase [Desulfatiglans sp.]
MKTSYKNLSAFIKALEEAGELKIIDHPVSTYLEISKITNAESKSPQGGKGLFFKNVEGSRFPVVTNLFGSPTRICMALGVKDLDDLGYRIKKYLEMSPPKNFKEVFRLIPDLLSVKNAFPRRSRSRRPPCQEVVYQGDAVDLSILPVLHCWPKDAGPFMTLPLVFTKSLSSGKRNMGMYRLQVFDKNTTGMHWHIHKDGSHFYQEYVREKRRMPVAVAIGADPATIYAATAPMPRNVDEMLLSGFIRNKPISMARCLTVDMQVPEEAEFVLEGYVDPGELRPEGPFGDHTGYYSLQDNYPVFHVTALTHRKSPVYCATLVGPPPMEDCYLAKATERIFLPMLQAVMPEIRDYWFPWEGVFHNIVIVSMDKEFPGHASKLMNGLWGQGQMSFCKAILVIDKNIDPKDKAAVMREILLRLDIMKDLTISHGILDVLDHSSPTPTFGAKIGIDLTARVANEPPRTFYPTTDHVAIPDSNRLLAAVTDQMEGVIDMRHILLTDVGRESSNMRNQILAMNVEKSDTRGGREIAGQVLGLSDLNAFNIILLYDRDIDLADNSLLLWKIFNNVDPERDLFFEKDRVVIDACRKGEMDGHPREWPDELVFDV